MTERDHDVAEAQRRLFESMVSVTGALGLALIVIDSTTHFFKVTQLFGLAAACVERAGFSFFLWK